MSDREFARAAVLRRVVAGEVSLAAATPLLGVSYRQAKRLVQRYRSEGRTGLVHRGTGRRSNRATPVAYRAAIVALVAQHYGGPVARGAGQRFGPTLTAEHLWTDHGVLVSVGTLTRWMREAGLWGRVRRVRPHHPRRERNAHFGELVQLDGSFHDWFEGRGPRPCVMTMVDDATGQTLLRFGAEETTWAAATVLHAWIQAHGVPRALYADWKNVYQRAPTNNELARGEAPLTQFGRMCTKLGITLIAASSPQAKGRVERGHGTHQDRLIKKLRLRAIGDIDAANAYVEATYLPAHNARFAVAPASAVDHHRVRDRRRWADADVFCLETTRVVGNDHVVQYDHQALQLDPRARGRVPAKSKVLVRELLDGTVRVVQVAATGHEHLLRWTPAAPRTARSAVRLPANGAPVRPPVTPTARPARPSPLTPEHPWRQQQARWVARALEQRDRRPTAARSTPATSRVPDGEPTPSGSA